MRSASTSASYAELVIATESSGRTHTSAVTVAMMPEADEVEVKINEERDLRIDVMRASGPGGQSVNTTDSAVRITHIPSGMVIICRDEKSQHKNKARALKILRSRLFELAQNEQQAKIADAKRRVGVQAIGQTGAGDGPGAESPTASILWSSCGRKWGVLTGSDRR